MRGLSGKQSCPADAQKAIDQIMRKYGTNFESWKKQFGFDSSTRWSDLKAGIPVKVYQITGDSLLKMDENAPVSAIVKSIDMWEVPLLHNGKCITTFSIYKRPKDHKWGIFQFRGPRPVWQKVRDAWQDSDGYHPIIIVNRGHRYYHVPEQNDSNLTPIERHTYSKLDQLADTNYKVLMPSRITLKIFKDYLHPKKKEGAQ